MKVTFVSTGETAELEEGYAQRLIEQGRAVAVRATAEKTKTAKSRKGE